MEQSNKIAVNRFFHPVWLGRICAFNIALLCLSFPISSALPVFFHFGSYIMNLGIKMFSLVMSIYLVVGWALQNRTIKLSPGAWWFLGFWAIYSMRFLHDTLVLDLVIRGNLFKLFAIAFGNCLIGSLAVFMTAKYISVRSTMWLFWATLVFSCLSVLVVAYSLQGTINPLEFAVRARFTAEINGAEIDVLNPITIGLHGALLFLASCGMLVLGTKGSLKRAISFAGAILGVWVLLLGGSRGPIVSTILGSLMLGGMFLWLSRKTKSFYLRLLTVPFIASGIFYTFFWNKIKFLELTAIRRLVETAESIGGTKEVRSYQWDSAIDMFISNPIIGDRYLERFANFYPHNIYLEVPMATGLIGTFFFVGLLFTVLWAIIQDFYMQRRTLYFVLFLIATYTGYLTSGSVFEGIPFWIFTALYLSVPRNEEASYIVRK